MSLSDDILRQLAQTDGQNAATIARALKVDRTSVNSTHYGILKGKVRRDSSYKCPAARRRASDLHDACGAGQPVVGGGVMHSIAIRLRRPKGAADPRREPPKIVGDSKGAAFM